MQSFKRGILLFFVVAITHNAGCQSNWPGYKSIVASQVPNASFSSTAPTAGELSFAKPPSIADASTSVSPGKSEMPDQSTSESCGSTCCR